MHTRENTLKSMVALSVGTEDVHDAIVSQALKVLGNLDGAIDFMTKWNDGSVLRLKLE